MSSDRHHFPMISALLGVLIAFSASNAKSALGQSETPSQRVLELPNSTLTDLPQQMQMLKQLRSWMNKKPQADSTNGTGFKPEQLDSIKQAMKQFGIPEGSMPDLSMIPPEVISQAMNDPQARQQISELLKEFSQTRRLPSADGSGGSAILPPSNRTDIRPGQSERSPLEPGQSAARPNPESQNRPTDGQPRGRGIGQESQQPPDTNSPESNSNDLGAIEDIQRRFDELQRKIRGSKANQQDQPARFPDASRRDGRQVPSSQPSTGNLPSAEEGSLQSPNGTPSPQDGAEWQKFLEDLIRGQRESNDTIPPLPGASQPGASQAGASQAGAQRGSSSLKGEGTIPNENSQQLSPELSDDQVQSIVSEFLKSQQLPAEAGSGDATAIDSQAAAEANRAKIAEEVRLKQQQAKSDLDQRGFQSTLNRIVREAKKQVASETQSRGAASGDAASPEGMNQTFYKFLNGVGKDLIKIAKDAKSDSATARRGASGRSNSTGNSSSTNKSPSWAKSAGDLISGLATAPDPPSASSSSSTGSLPNAVGETVGSGWVLTLFLLLAIAVIGGLLARKHRLWGPVDAAGSANEYLQSARIHSKQDVVRAFHQLALHPSNDVQTWWTHQKVEGQISGAVPDKQQPIATLAALYEEARYLPDDVAFDKEKLDAARDALEQCRA